MGWRREREGGGHVAPGGGGERKESRRDVAVGSEGGMGCEGASVRELMRDVGRRGRGA